MNRNWLIRTQAKKILGPVEKSEVLKLLQEKALSGEDEVSSGNGHWFWIREKDLVKKYLYGDKAQPFNPISEAESIFVNQVTGPSQKNEESVVNETLVIKRESMISKTEEVSVPRSEIKSDESEKPQKKKSHNAWVVFSILIIILSVAFFFLRPLL